MFFNKVSAQNTENIVERAYASDNRQSDPKDDLEANDQAAANSKPSISTSTKYQKTILTEEGYGNLSKVKGFIIMRKVIAMDKEVPEKMEQNLVEQA